MAGNLEMACSKGGACSRRMRSVRSLVAEKCLQHLRNLIRKLCSSGREGHGTQPDRHNLRSSRHKDAHAADTMNQIHVICLHSPTFPTAVGLGQALDLQLVECTSNAVLAGWLQQLHTTTARPNRYATCNSHQAALLGAPREQQRSRKRAPPETQWIFQGANHDMHDRMHT